MELIDVRKVIEKKSPKLASRIPRFVTNWLSRLIHQEELNELLIYGDGLSDVEFITAVLDKLEIERELIGVENLDGVDRPLFASNHPLGGIDGLILLEQLNLKTGATRAVVNDLLMNVAPIKGLFVPVNKHGSQKGDYANRLNELCNGNDNVLYFPAGLCSRLIGGEIIDLEWKKSFVQKAITTKRDIVPLFVTGRNSMKFYRLAKWRAKLGIKFNIEMLLLPAEMLRQKGKKISVIIGKPVKWETLNSEPDYRKWSQIIRKSCYDLIKKNVTLQNRFIQMSMKPIIQPVERELLEQELLPEFKLRDTNYGGNEIYVIDYKSAPSVMREIGRLREVAFRDAGGGTGDELDIDEYDLEDDGYKQLVVWDSEDREIVGGYRFIISRSSDTKYLSTEHYFQFSDKFRREYLPYSIELGRSFVQPMYQRRNLKSLFALDNLWDGIGALIVNNPDVKYFFGKVTMYGDYNTEARDLLIYFLNRYFGDKDELLKPINPVEMNIDSAKMESIFTGADYKENYKILTREIRNLNENIPPLINSYMNLSPTMKVFGTVHNREFGCVEETGILITLEDVYPKKKERHFINL